MIETDTLIIGCGIAGAAAALRLSSDPSQRVTVITRAPQALDSNTAMAQGGIVTRGLDDRPDLLVADILAVGGGLSSPHAARILADEGSRLVREVLIDYAGVRFDRDPSGALNYGLEAAHSRRRVLHVGDKTGWAIAQELLRVMQARPNITLLTEHTAVDLLLDADGQCGGALVLERTKGHTIAVRARATILATGGVGQLYANTTNPAGARGDGIAMAWRAGAAITNAEYVQFHPTALYSTERPMPLVSEAVRGEGAILVTPQGRPFMAGLPVFIGRARFSAIKS